VSPAVRITAIVLAIGLVAYAGWLLVRSEAPKPEVTEPKSAKTPRREKPANLNEAPNAGARPRIAPTRMRPTSAEAPDGAAAPVAAPDEMPPETARMRLKVLVEDIEAKAERGETMSQPEWVEMYKRGSELAQTLAKGTDSKDAAAQKEFGELNSRFRISIAKVQPRSP
jgi:hypothetical protein